MVHPSVRLFKFTLVLIALGLIGVVATLSSVTASSGAQTPAREGIEFFEKKIRPVLVANCYQCHSAQAKKPQAQGPEGGLLLDSRESMLKGGASGQPAVVPGDPDKSLLIRAIRYADPKLQMPLGGKLPDRIIQDFEEWVKMGAPYPRADEVAPAVASQPYDFDDAKKFWSFLPVKDRQPPQVKNEAWVKTPIDRFILARLGEKKLKPVADADRRTLIRRATFDLTGLPPSPREIDDFINDSSPNAFGKVVDRLLASNAYGERWGRHWLDLVRYADTAGCNSDFPVPQAYKYRNYVIKAFNEDKPYDQFIREQIAGDLLPHKDEADRSEKIIATGYIAISRRFGSRDTDHNLAIDDTIDNVGKAFLGLTTSCARCHDHKFDPIPTRDYYALYGIFSSTRYPFPGTEIYPHPHSLVPLATGKEAERLVKYQKEVGELELKKEALQVERGFARGRQREKETAPEVLAKSAGKTLKTDQIGRVVAIDKLIEEDHDDRNLKVAETSTRTVEQIEEELKKVKLRLAELGEAPKVEKAYAVAEGVPANSRIHRKGDNKNLGEVAPRGFLTILGGQRLPDGYKGSGRLELAKWLSGDENPLTARVMVNRIWLHHFGKGLVQTPNDFGKRGSAPTHPELLDYLAARFVAGGWSIKKLHRELMLSRVYQMGSHDNAANASIDAANNFLWRFNRRRLDAEEIRDAMLAVSDALERNVDGPHPFPSEGLWRYSQHNPLVAAYEHNGRGIYLMQQRIRAHPQLSIFDGADTNTATGERSLSTTPLQALFMLNNPFAHKQADNFAVRVGLAYADDARRIDYAYRLAFGRPPTHAEVKKGLQYLRDIRPDLTAIKVEEEAQTRAALASYLRVLLSSSEFIFVD
jgi:cytochrome c553